MLPKNKISNLGNKPYLATLGFLGLLLVGVGILSAVLISNKVTDKGIEIVEISEEDETGEDIFVDVAGAVIQPGLYRLSSEGRVNDALAAAAGLTESADRDWFSKNINLAAKLTDGAKIYIPVKGAVDNSDGQVAGSSNVGSQININTASPALLDRLWGVGPATAEKIIDGRPYASVEELSSKKVVNSNVYEQIKDEVTVY